MTECECGSGWHESWTWTFSSLWHIPIFFISLSLKKTQNNSWLCIPTLFVLFRSVVIKSMPKCPNYSLNIRCCHCFCGNGRYLVLTFVVIDWIVQAKLKVPESIKGSLRKRQKRRVLLFFHWAFLSLFSEKQFPVNRKVESV